MTTSVTAAQLAELRSMVGEPTTTTFSDAILTTIIESHALLDSNGEEQYMRLYLEAPLIENVEWIPTYDLNASAADVWDRKLATLISGGDKIDFSADGSSFRMSQLVDQYEGRVRYYRSRASSKTATLHKWPEETGASDFPWIINLSEES